MLMEKAKTEQLNKYAGKWVAIADNRVIVAADSLEGLEEQLQGKKPKQEPVYFLVPRKDEGPYVLFY